MTATRMRQLKSELKRQARTVKTPHVAKFDREVVS